MIRISQVEHQVHRVIRFPTLAPYLAAAVGELGSEAPLGVGELCMCICTVVTPQLPRSF